MLALAAGAALFVLAPLGRPVPAAAPPGERDRLLAERDVLFRSLRDLDLDHATGKLGDADYADLAARYRAQAIAVLNRLDALQPPGGPA